MSFAAVTQVVQRSSEVFQSNSQRHNLLKFSIVLSKIISQRLQSYLTNIFEFYNVTNYLEIPKGFQGDVKCYKVSHMYSKL